MLALGELRITDSDARTGTYTLQVNDKFDQIKEQLEKRAAKDKEFAVLVQKLQRGIIYGPGSLVYFDKDGKLGVKKRWG